MNESQIITIVQEGIRTVVLAAAPPLLFGLTIGVIVSIFQTVTSIQEPTLAFVPKILAVFFAIYFFGPWMLTLMKDYMFDLLSNIQGFLMY